jgi:hypothetical protein
MESAMRGLDPIVIERPEYTELWCRPDELSQVSAAIGALTGEPAEPIFLDDTLGIFVVNHLSLNEGCELLNLVRGGWPIEQLDRSTLRYRVSLARQLETMDPSPRCQL